MAIVIPSINTIFLLSPGTGSTSLSKWFVEHMGAMWILDQPKVKHATPQDILIKGVDLSNYVIATTTRHPLDFYISQYHKKTNWPGMSSALRLAKENSFRDFLRLFLDQSPSGYVHPIFLNAAEIVFRKESLEEDVNQFLRAIGLDIQATLPKANVSENLSHEFTDWYDEASINLVTTKHKEHFTRFNYSLESIEPCGAMEMPANALKKIAGCGHNAQQSPMVVPGKNGWLYLGNTSNQIMDCTTGQFSQVGAWISAWEDEVSLREQTAKSIGAITVTYVAPNTHSAIPDHLPDGIELSEQRPINVLLENIDGISYPLSELSDEACFIKNDSHYSLYGAYRLYRLVCEKMTVPCINFEITDFEPLELLGDLGRKCMPMLTALRYTLKDEHKNSPLFEDANKLYSSGAVVTGRFEFHTNPNALSDRTLLLYGDSYSYGLIQFFCVTFKSVVFAHVTRTPHNLAEEIKPDCVLFIHAERFMSQYPGSGHDAHLEDYRLKLLSSVQQGMYTPPPQYDIDMLPNIPWLLKQIRAYERIYDDVYINNNVNASKVCSLYEMLLGRTPTYEEIAMRLGTGIPIKVLVNEIVDSAEFLDEQKSPRRTPMRSH